MCVELYLCAACISMVLYLNMCNDLVFQVLQFIFTLTSAAIYCIADVQPRSVRSVDEVFHRRDKRVRRCACDCAC